MPLRNVFPITLCEMLGAGFSDVHVAEASCVVVGHVAVYPDKEWIRPKVPCRLSCWSRTDAAKTH